MTKPSPAPDPIIACHDITATEIEAIDEELYRFNRTKTGIDDGARLGFVRRDAAGAMIGAAVGTTWGGVCELKQLWVHEAHRLRGIGTDLLAAVLTAAAARGCHQVVLTTHSFQAPLFYERHGFERIAEIPDYPCGHRHIWMRCRLAMPPRG